MRLRRVRVDSPGLTRRRAGKGFVYLDADGARVTDPEVLSRCKALVIPPAWREVWISPAPNGHIQAVGIDDAGRKQYLYHPAWRERRDRAKHSHVLQVARALPAARERTAVDLARTGMPRDKALAVAFRLLDRGFFRVGGETYAERNGSFGLATIRKDHVRLRRDGSVVFDYLAKSGQRRQLVLEDPDLRAPVAMLRRRRGGGEELLAYRRRGEWVDITSADINAHVKELLGADASAKDFRTWHGTVLAALALARADDVATSRKRQRAVRAAVVEVSEHLGNTPTVCRASYIDPKVIDLFDRGQAVPRELAERAAGPAPLPDDERAEVEEAVLDLLA
ncbi:DNA topoisomerase IB [Georgenia faecalis]|uniref:DNA topoisomerase IB n=1 Tax=Georgenia faecalis TaxID=2483799 RepID=UPI000FDC5E68|nr:DNA topoisomerase IB [Georgenia faecalis]